MNQEKVQNIYLVDSLHLHQVLALDNFSEAQKKDLKDMIIGRIANIINKVFVDAYDGLWKHKRNDEGDIVEYKNRVDAPFDEIVGYYEKGWMKLSIVFIDECQQDGKVDKYQCQMDLTDFDAKLKDMQQNGSDFKDIFDNKIKLVGTIRYSMEKDNVNTGYIGLLTIHQIMQKKGLGSNLMKIAEAALISQGATSINLNMVHPINESHHVQTKVRQWYNKQGYMLKRWASIYKIWPKPDNEKSFCKDAHLYWMTKYFDTYQETKLRERTFIMIKPDGVQRNLIGQIIQKFEQKGLKLAAMKFCMPGREMFEKHYEDLSSKPFFASLVEYAASGPVCCMIWEGDNAIQTGRKILGATKPFDSNSGTIRGDLCVDVGRNICHGSDSVESANKEMILWFEHEEIVPWGDHSEKWVYE